MEQLSTFSSSDCDSVIARSPKGDAAIPGLLRSARNDIWNLGLTDYEEVRRWQIQHASDVALKNAKEVIVMTEHHPVYTCGRKTLPHERPMTGDIPIVDIERGGGLTYHGPGQIVGYPILNLDRRKMSIPKYLRKLEQALIAALAEEGIEARYREECLAGVWIGDKKVASIGIAVRRWVTFHGFALNVDCDLTPFRNARPCGMSGEKVTSLADSNYSVEKNRLHGQIAAHLMREFF
ncbi:MAG: lipoyl(octanoyl) transferase LipB [Deltaproteobacteria bacterium]|nr:lipoyl(octanoyl) transferase LipB [Deltaproteobacteria bacterium]